MNRNETSLDTLETTNDSNFDPHFDYDSVSGSVAKFLRAQADRIRRQCVTTIVQIGRALIESKRHLSHGAFLRWVEYEVGMPVRTAQSYMRVAHWASDKGRSIACMSPSALYLLSASTTPEEFVAQIISRAEAGEYIAPSVIRQELRAQRGQQRMDQQRSSSEQSIQLDPLAGSVSEIAGAERGLTEFVAILAERLAASDFARAREIVTSPTVLDDPDLPRKLGQAFESIEPACVQLVPD